tara:strand:- start:108 stop:404 length:297 start_codon:yes stop_codon:yes gene_type:complete
MPGGKNIFIYALAIILPIDNTNDVGFSFFGFLGKKEKGKAMILAAKIFVLGVLANAAYGMECKTIGDTLRASLAISVWSTTPEKAPLAYTLYDGFFDD